VTFSNWLSRIVTCAATRIIRHFRRLQGSADRFSVRIGDHYRALGTLTADTITWLWIGTHAEYDRLVG